MIARRTTLVLIIAAIVFPQVCHAQSGHRGKGRIRWIEPDRVNLIGFHNGPCADALNRCEIATHKASSGPGCGLYPPPQECLEWQKAWRRVADAACEEAAACKAPLDEAERARVRANAEKECKRAVQRRPRRPTCSYDGTPGDWTCRVDSCPAIKLLGVEVGTGDTDPCQWLHSFDSELSSESMENDESTPQGRRLDTCIDRARALIAAEYAACACEHPAPNGERKTTVCPSARRASPSAGVVGPGEGCRLVTPPKYTPDAQPAEPAPAEVKPAPASIRPASNEPIEPPP